MPLKCALKYPLVHSFKWIKHTVFVITWSSKLNNIET